MTPRRPPATVEEFSAIAKRASDNLEAGGPRRCRVGDLAIIVWQEFEDFQPNVGKIVEVLADVRPENDWLIETRGSLIESFGKTFARTHILDGFLRPLRGFERAAVVQAVRECERV